MSYKSFKVWFRERDWRMISWNWFKWCSHCTKFIIIPRDDWRSDLCDSCDKIVPENHN